MQSDTSPENDSRIPQGASWPSGATLRKMEIEIHIPRPGAFLFWSVAIIAGVVYMTSGGEPKKTEANLTAHASSEPTAEGGSGTPNAVTVQQAENDAKTLRIRQQVLSRRESILRDELRQLEDARSNDPDFQAEIEEARERLTALIMDKYEGERDLAASFQQIWEAQGYAMRLSVRDPDDLFGDENFIWPVKPQLGISAHFDDDGYQKLFGMPHQAIDIPVTQGSVVGAAADGIVAKVTDNGLGFNSIVIKHANGMATLYGHVSRFLVAEGDSVSAGEAIALSGGTPGTAGAGHMTTGAHLHFQMLENGSPVDPLPHLPNLPGIED